MYVLRSRLEQRKYLGMEAIANWESLSLRSPMERGIVKDWDDLENIYNHIFSKELNFNPSEAAVVLTEIYMSPKAQREKMLELLFEKFK